jgi:hypothetical protein
VQVVDTLLRRAGVVAEHGAQVDALFDPAAEAFDIAHGLGDGRFGRVATRRD